MVGSPLDWSSRRSAAAALLVAVVVVAATLTGTGIGVGVESGSVGVAVDATASAARIEPGESVTVNVTVENTGSTSISSLGLAPTTGGANGSVVAATSPAATAVTADHRVLFRTVAPGETVTATLTVAAGPTANGTLSVDATVAAGLNASEVTRTASASVSVEPNEPPTAGTVAVTTTENTSVTAGLNASDPNGDPLTYSLDVAPLHGSVTVGDGTFTYVPDDGYAGTDSFWYQVTDDDGETDTGYVSVAVEAANAAPSADAGPDRAGNALSTVALDATNSTDPDGDALTYDWTQTGGPSVSLSDAGTATPTFEAPDVDAATTLTFSVTVSDGNRTATDSVNVTVGPLLDPVRSVGADGRLQHAAVAVGPQLAFVGGLDSTLRAVSRADGSTAWTFDRAGSLSDSSPVYADGRVFVGSGGGVVYALDADNGSVAWTYRTDSAVVSSPTVVGTDGGGSFPGGTVYVGTNDGSILALNASSGALRWAAPADGPVYSTPAVDASAGRVYVTDDSGNMSVLDATTGARLWTFVTDHEFGHSSPVVVDGDVYVPADELYRIDAADDPGAVGFVWSHPYPGDRASTPTVAGGTVYLGTADGTVLALDAGNGSVAWNVSTGSPVSAAPTVVDGRLVVTAGSAVHLLDAGTGTQLAVETLGSRVRAPATVAGDAVYVGTRGGAVVLLGNVTDTGQ